MSGQRTDRVLGAGDRRCGGSAGFTLVELLVVVGIIAILLGLLLTGLGRASAAAKDVRCMSNLKQIALAWNMYLEDKRYFPRGVGFTWGGVDFHPYETTGTPGYFSPNRPLNPYFDLNIREKSRVEVFQCPRDHGFLRWNGGQVNYGFASTSEADDWQFTQFGKVGTSYWANEWSWMLIGKRGMVPPSPYGQTETNTPAMAVAPDKFPLVGDTGSWVSGRTTVEARVATNFAYAWWHGEQVCQMAMLDGSARRFVMTPGTAATRDYYFYLNPFRQPANSWVYASASTGTPPAPTHPFAYDWDYSN